MFEVFEVLRVFEVFAVFAVFEVFDVFDVHNGVSEKSLRFGLKNEHVFICVVVCACVCVCVCVYVLLSCVGIYFDAVRCFQWLIQVCFFVFFF